MRSFNLVLAVTFLYVVALEQQAHASAPRCQSLFAEKSSEHSTGLILDPNNSLKNQERITQFAKQNGLPVFIMTTQAGDQVPVILLNKKTIQTWSPLLEQSMGLNQSLHPGNPANHGWVRLPGTVDYNQTFTGAGALNRNQNPPAAIVDLFDPGQSAPQAINGNGYRWKSMSDYFNRRHEGSFVHIEQVFAVNREDQARIWLYQLVKRSSIVRIQYIFNPHNSGWIMGQPRVLQTDGPFNRRGCGEHCNNSRVGAQATHHAQEMRGRLQHFFSRDVDFVFSTHETKKFIQEAKAKMLSANWRESAELGPDFFNNDHFIELMRSQFWPDLTHQQRVDGLSYLFATRVFEDVVELKTKYQIDEEVEMGLGNSKLSAFIVYSELPDSPELFYQGRFEYFGAQSAGFSSYWYGLNSRPIYSSKPTNWENWRP